jgi:hypothetical protein
MEIYGLPDHWFPGKLNYYVVPRERAERYLEHPMLENCSLRVVTPVECEILGALDDRPTCEFPSHYRILIQGDFPDREDKFVVADGVLLARSGSELYYKNLDIEPMGDGKHLINALRGSDSGETEIPLDVLAKVRSYTEALDTEVQIIGHAPYALPAIKRLVLTMQDGSTLVAYSYSVGYFEGYQFNLFASKKSAYKDLREQLQFRAKAGWTALECWECGAVYSEPGSVEPGQMGCVRCNG